MSQSIRLDDSEYINLINLGLGLYKPLKGYNTKNELIEILKHKTINKKTRWTIPILLNAKEKKSNILNKECYLVYKKKRVGKIQVQSLFKINKKKFCKSIFNTNSINHPSVKKIYKALNFFVGGEISILKNYLKKDKYFAYNYFKQNKKIFSKYTAFTSRNISHIGHQHIHKKIINSKHKLLICIIVSEKNKFNPDFIIQSYNLLKSREEIYKQSRIVKIYLPSLMAGPNEAYLQATYLNNMNCKSMIIGRDHAGFKNNFKKYDSQHIFNHLNNLNIKIIKTKEPLFCENCNTVFFHCVEKCKCKSKDYKNFLSIDGKNIKNFLLNNNHLMASKYLNKLVYQYCLKNIKKLKKFKG